ncbi:coiled-coil domain-containing protein 77-like [Strongylocentrotus purpuratus]|uniref:Uncharacterized protein n=1 Tax=Strongylocentrotus purpuratus TaxID=7668 RepID=A0A7M7NIK3_STRPU|nr:coiled-coil domain-containing protein 77-like [Strongylocentrotus purpuratus]
MTEKSAFGQMDENIETKERFFEKHKLEWELRQREEEIAELQKALSDMQVYLFQERDHVLRLFAENDRLKIQELEDRKRIQHLLSLSSPSGPEVTYFHKEPSTRAIVTQKHPQKRHPHSNSAQPKAVHPDSDQQQAEPESLLLQIEALQSQMKEQAELSRERTEALLEDRRVRMEEMQTVIERDRSKIHSLNENAQPKAVHPDSDQQQAEPESLLLQIEALQSQMKEQAELSREQTEALLEDRRVRMEEMQTVIERDRSKIHSLNEKLHRTQQMLYDSTKDYLELKYEGRSQERVWMAEKDRLLQELDRCKEH